MWRSQPAGRPRSGQHAAGPPPWLHTVALFVHLASLIVGFGAVLMVDWYALLWVTEWRTVRDLRQVDITLKLPIWVGIIGLLASGALLQPDLGSPLTLVKLGAVLVLSLNGVAITRWTTSLARFPRKTRFSSLPRAARIQVHHERRHLAGRLVDRRRHRHAELHLLTADRRRRRRARNTARSSSYTAFSRHPPRSTLGSAQLLDIGSPSSLPPHPRTERCPSHPFVARPERLRAHMASGDLAGGRDLCIGADA